MKPLAVTSFTCVTALGAGRTAHVEAIISERGGLLPYIVPGTSIETYVGRVEGLEKLIISGELALYDCRNNRLAEKTLQCDGFVADAIRAVERYGESRVGVVLGTSTSGIAESEKAFSHFNRQGCLPGNYDYRHTHELNSLSEYVRRRIGANGPSYVVSTACSSSAKCFVDAFQLIEAEVCDAVVVGGVDSLCLTTLLGFNSLQLLSSSACRPNDVNRDGISIGEAGGLVLLERANSNDFQLYLLGYGESSDAYHIATPHPEGRGKRIAMQEAIRRADISASQIDYLNLHGTGTLTNDIVEGRSVFEEFGMETSCSSTKGWTGHALGAAGIVEAVICLLALREGFIPGNLNLEKKDPEIPIHIQVHSERGVIRCALSNNFGFGGNNCSLIFGISK